MKILKRIQNWWEAHFLRSEFAAAVALSVLFILWSELMDQRQFINSIISGRGTIYGTLVALFGTMLGFTITAVSIVLGFVSKLDVIRKSTHYSDMWDVFKSAMVVLTFATIVALIGLIFDKASYPLNWLFYLNVFASILSFFRIARCTWVLANIIKIVTMQQIG